MTPIFVYPVEGDLSSRAWGRRRGDGVGIRHNVGPVTEMATTGTFLPGFALDTGGHHLRFDSGGFRSMASAGIHSQIAGSGSRAGFRHSMSTPSKVLASAMATGTVSM